MTSRIHAIVVALMGLTLFGCAREKPAENKLTATEAKALATEAYISPKRGVLLSTSWCTSASSRIRATAPWSVTMYDKDGYLVENALKRFAVGDRSKLKPDADGSLPIYIQHASPGKGKEANWLPVPEEPFKVYLRLYTPEQKVLDGNWVPPAAQKVP